MLIALSMTMIDALQKRHHYKAFMGASHSTHAMRQSIKSKAQNWVALHLPIQCVLRLYTNRKGHAP